MSRPRKVKKIRVCIGLILPHGTPATPEQLEKARAFIIAAKKRIQRRQDCQIEIVSRDDSPAVIYDPITKESYFL